MATVQVPVNIEKFTGVNLREEPGVINDHQLQQASNFVLGRQGELIKRTGFEKINTANLGINAIKLIGFYQTATYSQILARIGTSLYYSTDAINWTLIGTSGQYTVEYGCQYNDKFYMVRKGAIMLEWNGAAIATVAGSPGGDFCIIHKERIFILDSSGTGQPNYRLYFSNVLAPTDWGTGGGSVDINSGDGDFLVGAAIVHDLLVVFKTRSTWGVYVQTNKIDWVTRSLNKSIGCSSKYSIRVIEDLVYFVSATNVYRTDGTSFKSISDDILPVLKDRIINQTNVNTDDGFFWNDVYVVRLNPTTSSSRYFAYNIRNGGWIEWIMSGSIGPSSFLEIRASVVPSPGVYAGDFNAVGNIYRYGNNVYADNGQLYTATLRTKDSDFGVRGNIKRGKWLTVDTVGAAALTITHYVNMVAGTPQSINSSAVSQTQKAVGPGYFRSWAIDVSVSSGVAFTLFGFTAFIHRKRTQIGASV